ncbi:TPA: hypothetical protein ACIYYU_004273 [Escherichia coli]
MKQVVNRGHSVSSVATRLDITTHSLYAGIKKHGPDYPLIKKSQMLRPRSGPEITGAIWRL